MKIFGSSLRLINQMHQYRAVPIFEKLFLIALGLTLIGGGIPCFLYLKKIAAIVSFSTLEVSGSLSITGAILYIYLDWKKKEKEKPPENATVYEQAPASRDTPPHQEPSFQEEPEPEQKKISPPQPSTSAWIAPDQKELYWHIVNENEIDDNLLSRVEPNSFCGKNDKTLMHVAASVGNLELLKKLIKKGGDIHKKDKDGKTSAYYAIYEGRINIVKYLIENQEINANEALSIVTTRMDTDNNLDQGTENELKKTMEYLQHQFILLNA